MNTVLDIGRLSHTEKLRAMEELWNDLSRSQEEYPSPDWHGDVLRAREEALNAGRDAFVPWEEAKAILRASTKCKLSSSVPPLKTWFAGVSFTKNKMKDWVPISRTH